MGGVASLKNAAAFWNEVEFMPAKKILDKAGKIKREKNRLNKVFKDLDKNKFATVQSLINTAAFIAISLDELQDEINKKGYTEKYKNGANQYGIKQSSTVETHIAMTRNLTTIIKQLTDLAPQEKRKDGKLAAFQRE